MSGAMSGPVWQLRVGFWAPLEAQSLLPWTSRRPGQEWMDRTGKGKIFFHLPLCKREPRPAGLGTGSFAG